ncbi:hypothetical protein [Pseudorhodobacter aquimaris]|uniref:hypothetical protein n=1 Tax=Pseudorhodobacter aquimaris TaxID=687412 RepID=UPI00067D780D|nr:hypothetical protein [Pseudorhodobacter aquimaris]
MTYAKLLPCLLLLACGNVAPVPQSARLGAEHFDLVMSDGSHCSAPVGAGRMPLCGAGFDYRVQLVQNPNALRAFMEGAFGALGMRGVLAPMGVVTLTDDAGREYRFVSPPPDPAQ